MRRFLGRALWLGQARGQTLRQGVQINQGPTEPRNSLNVSIISGLGWVKAISCSNGHKNSSIVPHLNYCWFT